MGCCPRWSIEHIGSCNPRAVACFNQLVQNSKTSLAKLKTSTPEIEFSQNKRKFNPVLQLLVETNENKKTEINERV